MTYIEGKARDVQLETLRKVKNTHGPFTLMGSGLFHLSFGTLSTGAAVTNKKTIPFYESNAPLPVVKTGLFCLKSIVLGRLFCYRGPLTGEDNVQPIEGMGEFTWAVFT